MSAIETVEAEIKQLPLPDQLQLLSNLSARLKPARKRLVIDEAELEAMANDPQIQREIAAINADFAEMENDGLEKY